MIDILNKHLTSGSKGCSVNKWLLSLSNEEQEVFATVKENSEKISVASLFADLTKEELLPFKLTAFRSHLRGYCTCQN